MSDFILIIQMILLNLMSIFCLSISSYFRYFWHHYLHNFQFWYHLNPKFRFILKFFYNEL